MKKVSSKNSGGINKKIFNILFILLVLSSVLFVSGCVSQPQSTLKSDREVGEAVTNVSQDVEDVSNILNDIDKKFG